MNAPLTIRIVATLFLLFITTCLFGAATVGMPRVQTTLAVTAATLGTGLLCMGLRAIWLF